METLNQLKLRMKQDKEMRARLVRGGRHEILLDLDGDKYADLGLMDENMDGIIDTLAMDLRGSGDFDLYLTDSDNNSIIDRIWFDEKGEGIFSDPEWDEQTQALILEAATALYLFLKQPGGDAEQLEKYLEQMSVSVAKAAEII